jgi:hypothetical protein
MYPKHDSWAIRWYASAFLLDKLTLYPGRSLVQNIGNDSTGTHCGKTNVYDAGLYSGRIRVEKIPLIECNSARQAIRSFQPGVQLRSKPSLWARMRHRFQAAAARTGLRWS